MGYGYPSEDAIVDPRKILPPERLKLLEPCYAAGQWRLRGCLHDQPRTDQEIIEILLGIALDVMGRLVQVALREHADDFDAFRAAVEADGGAADLGLKYAHFIYLDATHGRMRFTWHNPICDQIKYAESRAENEYWQNDRARHVSEAPAQARAPRDVAAAAEQRKTFLDPLLLKAGLSLGGWASEANVDYHTASDYYHGLTNPHRSTLVRLGKALGLLASQLP